VRRSSQLPRAPTETRDALGPVLRTDMLVTKIPSVYEVELPSDVRRFLGYFSIVISVGLSDTTSFLTCLGMRGYEARLVLWMLVPPVLVGTILIGSVASLLFKRSLSRSTLVESALPLIVRLLFLLYPLIANVAFEAFSCYPEFEDGTRYLIVDVSIACDSNAEEYTRVYATAWLAIGVYAFGLLALNAALLFNARKAIVKRVPTTLSRAIHFLYCEFEPYAHHLTPRRASFRPANTPAGDPLRTRTREYTQVGLLVGAVRDGAPLDPRGRLRSG
jgi:hypothetical protein